MTKAFDKFQATVERFESGDASAIVDLREDARAVVDELRKVIPDVIVMSEAWIAAKFSRTPNEEFGDKAKILAAIAANEEANRRCLEACGMDPSRATELANAQRAALKEAQNG